MSQKLIYVDANEIARWEGEGGRIPPDEEAEEQRREDFATLRNAIVSRADSPAEAEILLAFVSGFLSASEFGNELRLNRSNGLRRLRGGLSRFGRKLISDPTFREEVPERFWHLFPE